MGLSRVGQKIDARLRSAVAPWSRRYEEAYRISFLDLASDIVKDRKCSRDVQSYDDNRSEVMAAL